MTRYSPGEWYGVVTPAGVALLPRSVPMAAVERVWMDLRAGQGLAAVIDGLVGAFGTSLARLPDFGVLALTPDGEVRAAIRGAIDARLWLVGMPEPIVISGAGVTTWNERSHSGIGRAELAVADSVDGELLPVIDGVLRAGRVDVAILEFDTQPQELPLAPQELLVVPQDQPVVEPTRWTPPTVSRPLIGSTPPAEPAPLPELTPTAEPAPLPEPTPLAESPEPAVPDAPLVEQSDPPPADELADQPDDPRSADSRPSDDLAPGVNDGDKPEAEGVESLAEITVEPDPVPLPQPVRSIAQTTIIELNEDQGIGVVAGSGEDDLGDVPVDYDKLLFGETMMSSAEEAAVRVADEDEAEDDSNEARSGAGPDASTGAGESLPAAGESAQLAELSRSASQRQPPPPPPPLPAGLIAGLPSFGAPPPPPPHAAPASPWADHDGETVMVEGLQAALAARATGPAIAQQPSYARLLIPGRSALPLDRSTIVGTRPRLTRAPGDKLPQLVAVESPNGEISRSHLELRVEGAHVLAIDLNSTNGTVLLRVGSDPIRFQPGEPNMLVNGDRVDLGDGLVLAFEGLG